MKQGKLFKKLGFWTLGAVYFLILVGGIVRATGSGMGCPDWPKCFGAWVPPTDISQLPPNYKEIYGAKLKGEVEFNVLKTWIEYVNRLVGVFIGFLVFATFLSSFFAFRKTDKLIVYLTFLSTILVGFEGWLGSKVVSSELHPLMITLHMLVSIIIVFVLLYAVARSSNTDLNIETVKNSSSVSFLLVITMLFTLGQVVLGTQVREMIDIVAQNLGESLRANWVSNVGGKYTIHASFSVIVALLNALIYNNIKKSISERKILFRFAYWLIVIVGIEIITGIVLGFMGFPRLLQPIHLTLGTLILGIQFIIYLFLNKDRVFRSLASK